MILNNFKKIVLNSIFGSESTAHNIPTFRGTTLKDINGNDVNIDGGSYGNTGFVQNSILNAINNPALTSTSGTLSIKVGTGTSDASESDYAMENENQNLTINSISTAFTSNLTKVITATIGNPTQNNIDVTEIGLFITANDRKTYMIEHTVKAVPITVPSGQNKAITVELSM